MSGENRQRSADSSIGTDRRNFLKVTGAALAGSTGLAGCTQVTGGGASGSDGYTFGYSVMGRNNAWLEMCAQAGEWYAGDHGISLKRADAQWDPAKQVQDCSNMIRQGIDALVFNPVDPEASRTIVDKATDEDIPVFCPATASNSAKTKMFLSFDNKDGGRRGAKLIVEQLKEKYGEPRGHVLEVLQTRTLVIGRLRTQGFNAVMNQYPDITVGQINGNENEAETVTKTVNYLRSNGEVDAVFGESLVAGAGSYTGLERMNMAENVIHGQIDAAPRAIDRIKEGKTDWAVDQAVHFYAPLVMEYTKRYLDAGKDDSVIPEPGSTVTSDDLVISGDNHLESDVWGEQIWSPAYVQTTFGPQKLGYPFFQANSVLVTKDNADGEYLWGNIARNL